MNEKENTNNTVKQLIANTTNENVSTSVNWMGKLKPSVKNKLITNKYQNLSRANECKKSCEDLAKYGIDKDALSVIDKDNQLLNESNYGNKNYLQKWNKFVEQSKFGNLQINTNNQNVDENFHFDLDNSIQYFEEIGNMIEEKYKIAYSENMFLKQQENHSIIPFMLIHSKEIHRVCLSDYEIKYSYKSYKTKSKSYTPEAFDYYKIGLINFYKGKYFMAYNNLLNAIKFKSNDPNILKWYCFVSIILLFCDNNKIDFSSLKSIKIDNKDEGSNDNNEEDGFSFFSCCSSRKANNTKPKTIQQIQLLTNNNGANNINDYLITSILNENERETNITYINMMNNYNHSVSNMNKTSLAKEILEMLTIVINPNTPKNTKANQIEGWWIYLIISTFALLHPTQKLFPEKSIFDPKYCIKKIKEKDDYIAYIAYAEYNYIITDDFPIDKLLKQLISKYPNKVEAYLRYWQLLVKGKYKNYEVANSLSTIYWKNSSNINFDDGIYSLYILITHAKSSYLVGNHFYAITYFQKEYPSNFLFPSIYYLFGKYTSKSNSKSLKNISLSSLKEVYRLLYEDLQYSVLYWIGNVYYNTGVYHQCYKFWRIYYLNCDRSFDITQNKAERIKSFLNKYELLYNSLSEFKKNLMLVRKYKSKVSKTNSTNTNFNTNSQTSKQGGNSTEANSLNKVNTPNRKSTVPNNTSTKLASILKTLESIQELENNLKLNKTFIYEYYKALSYFYIDRNIFEAMRLSMNIINTKKHFMKAYFAIWKILVYLKEYKLLLNFSYFAIKVSHFNEVTFSEWVKVYILYSRALLLNKKQDDSVMILINLLDVFAHIPMEDAKYLNDIYKQNKISTTNFFVNFDKALQFYSKYHVYQKSTAIFQLNYTLKKMKKNNKSEKFVLDIKDIKEDGNVIFKSKSPSSQKKVRNNEFILSPNSNVTINIDSINQVPNDINIDSIEKLQEYIELNIDLYDVPVESPFLTIVSDPDIFFEIGKSCAKSEFKKELGLMCLEDYIHLLKFTYNYKLSEKKDKKKQKAYFWLAILKIQLKLYNEAKIYVDKIDKLYEFDHNKKKSKILKLFVDFYEQFISINESISYDFEISKDQLQDI